MNEEEEEDEKTHNFCVAPHAFCFEKKKAREKGPSRVAWKTWR